jgi:outer membrane protein insertion porin family
VDITFNVNEGKPAHIRRVSVTGNTTTADKVIRREINLFPGDVFRQSLMERSFRDIMQLNFFDNVKPDLRVSGEQDVDLIFDVAERKAGTGQFSAGMSFNGSDGLMGNLSVSIPNFSLKPFGIGGGQKVDAQIDFGAYTKRASFGFSEPWFQDKPTTLGGSVSWYQSEDLNRNVAKYQTYGVSAYVGTRLKWPDDFFYIQGNVGYNWIDQDHENAGLVRYSGREASVGLTITRDDKNLPMFPTDGSRYQLSVQRIGDIIPGSTSISDFEYWNTEAKVKWWFPLPGGLSIGMENELGVLSGSQLKARSLYQMGGIMGYQGKLRGVEDGQVGRDLLGRSYFSTSTELIYTVAPGSFYLIPFFFDAGNVFGPKLTAAYKSASQLPSSWSEIDLGNLEKDVGAGFRVVVPMMGILGFDFGFPLGQTISTKDMKSKFVITQGF